VGGTSVREGQSDFALLRYNVDGSLDSTFGSGGVVVTDFGGGHDGAVAVVLQPDGKIVAAGVSDPCCAGFDFALARYNRDGSLDSGFGSGGKVLTDFGTPGDEAFAVALQSDGKIVAGGTSWSSAFALARYNTDGSLDASFGSGGKVKTVLSTAWAFGLAVQPNGKIVAAGGSNNDFAVARYTPRGRLDPAFGSGGIVSTDFGGFDERAHAVLLQRDGRIVAVGSTDLYPRGGIDFALARYNRDGSLDSGFGSGGKVLTNFGGHSADVAYAAALQTDNMIVAAGASNHSSRRQPKFALVRYRTDGSLDAGFGSEGKVLTDFPSKQDTGHAVLLQPDGKIVAAGATGTNNRSDFALARYLAPPSK